METIKSIKDFNTFDTAVVSTSNRILPEIIQSCQRIESPSAGMFNHAFKLYVDENVNVIEAEEQGIVKNLFSEYLSDSNYTMILVLRPKFAFFQSDIDYMLSFVNRAKYDFFGLLGEALRFVTTPIAKLFGKKNGLWLGSNMTSNKRFMCGMFAGYIDAHANKLTNKMFNIPIPEIAPVDLVLNDYYDHIWVDMDLLRKEAGVKF